MYLFTLCGIINITRGGGKRLASHNEIINYRTHIERRLTITEIIPAILTPDGNGGISVERLDPIRVIGGLDDEGVFKEIKRHFSQPNVLPYSVSKYSEHYKMTLKEFTKHAELIEKTKIKGGI